ncbi:MAG: hypothetical protein ACLQU2_33655 [Candidatus Binataceae bacterium]
MPRRSSSESGSAFNDLQEQARGLLATLRKEIRVKEAELKRLKEDESRLGLVTGTVRAAAVAAPSARTEGGGGRINWRTVLEQLPKQFKASDIRSVRGLKDKRPSEIFAAVTRWIEAGTVKRKTRGLYERAS